VGHRLYSSDKFTCDLVESHPYSGKTRNGRIMVVVVVVHCVSKKRPTFTTCCYFYIHSSIVTILAQMLPRNQAIKMYFIFPPHLTSASALPGKQETQKLRLLT